MEAVLLQAYHEKTGFFGNYKNYGEKGRRQGKRKTNMRWSDSIKEAEACVYRS